MTLLSKKGLKSLISRRELFFILLILTLLVGCKSQESVTGETIKSDTTKEIGDIKTFHDSGDAAVTEDGKPLIILFSTTWCPHCKWVKETFDDIVKEYGDQIAAYHWELDTKDNTLTMKKETSIPAEHTALYQKFNPKGSIPTYVFGGKYYRVGNGYERQGNLEAEAEEFRAVIDTLLQ